MSQQKLIKITGDVTPDETVTKFRRIVTGHDAAGKAIFTEDTVCANVKCLFGMSNHTNTELWKSVEMPVDNSGEPNDNIGDNLSTPPPGNGTVIRVVEFPAACAELSKVVMHRTPTLDYAYVIKGEIAAVLDDGVEKVMKAGDVLIQRGTNHGWINRAPEPCAVLFVLIDAKEVHPSEY